VGGPRKAREQFGCGDAAERSDLPASTFEFVLKDWHAARKQDAIGRARAADPVSNFFCGIAVSQTTRVGRAPELSGTRAAENFVGALLLTFG